SLTRRLAATPQEERATVVLDLVRDRAAAVLGHGTAQAVEVTRAFAEMGFDSLTAVEFRNRLDAATGARLPATLVFDYPTPVALAEFLLAELLGTTPRAADDTPVPARPDEPIAIIGMSCRFPGGVSSPEEFWRLLTEGTDAIGPFPGDRGWDLGRLHADDGPGTSPVREGGFLYDAPEFDAGFFGISPREALAMDPQQRLLLEATWESLEHAGIDPAGLRGSRTGVFAGTNGQDYVGLVLGSSDSGEGHLATGNNASIISGRVAYS
ncbi:acyl carrier protein, partial [Actinoalloteichus caeruleus]|uniref:acyl carrier protein n=1 Tax=Actinoalloteichus cyanogriseus TaxID=2893586 RepID=UPI00054E6897